MEPMRDKVSQKPRAITGVFAPAMEMFGAERRARLHRAEPALPIYILSRGFVLEGVVPLTTHTIAAVVTLTPDESADLAAVDQFSAFMPTLGGTALRADLVNSSRPLDCIIDLEGFIEITRHWLLTIHVLAGFHGVYRKLGVPRVVRGDEHGINVFAFEQFSVIRKNIRVF